MEIHNTQTSGNSSLSFSNIFLAKEFTSAAKETRYTLKIRKIKNIKFDVKLEGLTDTNLNVRDEIEDMDML